MSPDEQIRLLKEKVKKLTFFHSGPSVARRGEPTIDVNQFLGPDDDPEDSSAGEPAEPNATEQLPGDH